jgi:hypothetical protein
MFARPKKPSSRQRIGEVDHSFMKIAKPLIDHSSVNDMRANPLFDRPPNGHYQPGTGILGAAVGGKASTRQAPAGSSSDRSTGSERENRLPAMNERDLERDRERERERERIPKVTIGFGHSSGETDHRPKSLLGLTREDQQEMCAKNREKTDARQGDNKSFSYNLHGSTYIDKRSAVRMFRVLCIKHPTPGSEGRVVFDPLDGRIFSVAPGFHNRISHNVLLYDTKKAAMSERLPPNQVGAGSSGNGRYARILCSFGKFPFFLLKSPCF